MAFYINFYFKKIIYDEKTITGEFGAPDNDVKCCFCYDISTQEYTIWGNNRSVDEIIPLPIGFLVRKLKEKGILNENEYKISY